MKRTLCRAFHVAAFLLVTSLPALAHGGKPHNWHDLTHAWSFEPLVVVTLIFSVTLFWVGLIKLRRAAPQQKTTTTFEVWCFVGGWLSLFIALISPLHAWGRVLFSAHMTQHEVLMLIAAPLLVLGRPLIAFMWAIPMSWARRLGVITRLTWVSSIWRVITVPLF